jgi:hypothetical protein
MTVILQIILITHMNIESILVRAYETVVITIIALSRTSYRIVYTTNATSLPEM